MSPGVTRRVAHSLRACAQSISLLTQSGVRTFLPPRLLGTSDHPAHPPIPIISRHEPEFRPCCDALRLLQSLGMNARQAKDFLVNQAAEQASLDGIPLSDLEKRMMCFTESDDSCQVPLHSMRNLSRNKKQPNTNRKIHAYFTVPINASRTRVRKVLDNGTRRFESSRRATIICWCCGL